LEHAPIDAATLTARARSLQRHGPDTLRRRYRIWARIHLAAKPALVAEPQPV